MLIAGEASGDQLAAELVAALRGQVPEAAFFGAGGARMSAAGVTLVQEMSRLAVVGITDVLAKVFELRRLMQKLLACAIERQPDVIIGVDYGGFNLRLGHAIQEYVRNHPFSKWQPKLVQFVSPPVWASRPGRAQRLAQDYDLLLSIFPFEKDWYAQRVPQLRVEFVGHPMVGRFTTDNLLRPANDELRFARGGHETTPVPNRPPHIILLPGSRKSELRRHLPPMLRALELMKAQWPGGGAEMSLPEPGLTGNEPGRNPAIPFSAKMILPTQALTELAGRFIPPGANLEIQIGGLPQALQQADLALAKTGTVTMECAFFGVPTVTLYRGSWLNYQIARHLITVKTFTMPNLLANEEVYPEFLQYDLTAENLARAALNLLQNDARRQKIKAQLDQVIASLGEPGAPQRAATAILSLLA
jgi:lipid-A-disaccharide synthase